MARQDEYPSYDTQDLLHPRFALALLLESKEYDTLEVVATRKKWEEDELICRGHILNIYSDRPYDLNTNTKSIREIWESLENK